MRIGLVNSKSFWLNQAWATPSCSAFISLVSLFIEELRRCYCSVGQFRRKNYVRRDFPGGALVKNPPANAGDMGSSPGPRRSHMPRSN